MKGGVSVPREDVPLLSGFVEINVVIVGDGVVGGGNVSEESVVKNVLDVDFFVKAAVVGFEAFDQFI